MSDIEAVYQARMDELTPLECVARSMAMLRWSREWIGRQILATSGPMSPERLKWEVALRMYGAEPQARSLILRQLARVSH